LATSHSRPAAKKLTSVERERKAWQAESRRGTRVVLKRQCRRPEQVRYEVRKSWSELSKARGKALRKKEEVNRFRITPRIKNHTPPKTPPPEGRWKGAGISKNENKSEITKKDIAIGQRIYKVKIKMRRETLGEKSQKKKRTGGRETERGGLGEIIRTRLTRPQSIVGTKAGGKEISQMKTQDLVAQQNKTSPKARRTEVQTLRASSIKCSKVLAARKNSWKEKNNLG